MINVHIVIQMLIHVSITASYLTNDCSFLYQFMIGEASVKHINQDLFRGALFILTERCLGCQSFLY